MAEDRGLLGKIGSGIQSLLGNPLAQGIGTAAAFGFNPLVGLLAEPTLRNNREVATLRNEQARAAVEGQRAFTDILGRNVPQPMPTQELLQVDAPSEFVGFRSKREVPFIQTPEGQQEAMAAISQFAPGAVAQNLLQKQSPTRVPADIQVVDAIQAARANGDTERAELLEKTLSKQDPLALLRATELQLQVQKMIQQQQEAAAGQQQEEVSIPNELDTAGNLLLSVDRAITNLEGSNLFGNPLLDDPDSDVLKALQFAPEFGFAGAANLAGLQGVNSKEELQTLLDRAQTFGSQTNTLLNNVLENLTNVRSDFRAEIVQSNKPTFGVRAGPNRVRLSNIIQQTLNEDEKVGFKMNTNIRRELESAVEGAKEFERSLTPEPEQTTEPGPSITDQAVNVGAQAVDATQRFGASLFDQAQQALETGAELTKTQINRAKREIRNLADAAELTPEQREQIDSLVVNAKDVSAEGILQARAIIDSAVDEVQRFVFDPQSGQLVPKQ